MTDHPKYGVQSAAFIKAIHIGRITKDGARFLDGKEDATANVLHAVGRHALDHYGGSMWVEVGGLHIEIAARDLP